MMLQFKGLGSALLVPQAPQTFLTVPKQAAFTYSTRAFCCKKSMPACGGGTLQEQQDLSVHVDERCVDQKSGQTQHTTTTTTIEVASEDIAHATNVPVLCLAFVGLQFLHLRLCVACHEPG